MPSTTLSYRPRRLTGPLTNRQVIIAARGLTWAGVVAALMFASAARADEVPPETLLFGFEEPAAVGDWKPVKLPEVAQDQPAPQIQIVPASQATGALDAASTGKCLKITFHGGDWPTIGTTTIPVAGNWKPFHTIKADLTVDRPSVAYFRIPQSGLDTEPKHPAWQKTLFLLPGRNQVQLTIRHGLGSSIIDPKRGEITSFIIGMFQPQEGQSLWVDNVRLTADWPEPQVTGWYSPYNHDGYSSSVAREFQRTGKVTRFKVLGTDLEVADLPELAKLLKDRWTPPEPKTIDQIEGDMKSELAKLKPNHPQAVLAILREGEQGWNPAKPAEPYAGWSMAYISSHGPDGPNQGREKTPALGETMEAFMRHRVMLMRADLASIPRGAAILSARLVVTREPVKDLKAPEKPNLWVVEPCNRAWDPASANCYFYAPGKHWKAVNGLYYGDDPDCWPVFAAHGPAGGGVVSDWDFSGALKSWVDGDRPNHGFFLHCLNDYMRLCTSRAKDVKLRPAVMVIYEPK